MPGRGHAPARPRNYLFRAPQLPMAALSKPARMPKPVILAVDDDPEVLNAVERDLRQHFRADYRVMKVGSGADALDTTRQLKKRGSMVALFLVDERMPEMTGTQFLSEAIKLYPDARRVLLTAYADTE